MIQNSNTSKASVAKVDAETLLDVIIDSIQDIKGKNITKIDLRAIDDSPTDFFVICDGESSTQIRAIATNIQKRVKTELKTSPSRKEGETDARWQLLDYFDIVVHIFYPETRAYYDLEDLWSDGAFTTYENID